MYGKESACITSLTARPGIARSAHLHVATSTFTTMGRTQNIPLGLLRWQGSVLRHHQWWCEQSTEGVGNGSWIPYGKGDPDRPHWHPFALKWWRQCPIPVWLLEYPNSKDGTVMRHYFQRIHPRVAGVLLHREVQEHEKEIRLRIYHRQHIQHHNWWPDW